MFTLTLLAQQSVLRLEFSSVGVAPEVEVGGADMRLRKNRLDRQKKGEEGQSHERRQLLNVEPQA